MDLSERKRGGKGQIVITGLGTLALEETTVALAQAMWSPTSTGALGADTDVSALHSHLTSG